MVKLWHGLQILVLIGRCLSPFSFQTAKGYLANLDIPQVYYTLGLRRKGGWWVQPIESFAECLEARTVLHLANKELQIGTILMAYLVREVTCRICNWQALSNSIPTQDVHCCRYLQDKLSWMTVSNQEICIIQSAFINFCMLGQASAATARSVRCQLWTCCKILQHLSASASGGGEAYAQKCSCIHYIGPCSGTLLCPQMSIQLHVSC